MRQLLVESCASIEIPFRQVEDCEHRAKREILFGFRGPLPLRAFAFGAEGKVGYIIGGFARKKADQDRGKFTLTLRTSAEGRWLIVSYMDNANQHPASPSAPAN